MRLRFGHRLRPLQRSVARCRSAARCPRTTSSSGSARLACLRKSRCPSCSVRTTRSSCTASCMGPSASCRVQAALTYLMDSTEPRGMWASAVRSTSSPNRRSRGSPPGHINVAGDIFRYCLPRATATTPIILVTLQNFLRECAHNIEFQTARTGTKQSSTSSGRRTVRSGIFRLHVLGAIVLTRWQLVAELAHAHVA